MEENKVSDILNVLGGNKEFKVGIETNHLILFGLITTISVFLAVYTANKLSK